MKAIVANLLFGGILGCLGWAETTLANPQSNHLSPDISLISSVSDAVNLATEPAADLPIQRVADSIFTKSEVALSESYRFYGGVSMTLHALKNLRDSPSLTNKYYSSLGKQAYVHHAEEFDLVLGFQKAFWSSNNQGKYWGITTVEQWGGNHHQQLNLPQLNYIDSAPILAAGNSALTFTSGGNSNLAEPLTLAQDQEYSPDFDNFRGGVAYHYGLDSELTMGVGFIYEDNFAGFTQLVYDSKILPLQTTFSLIAKDAAIGLHSHVLFKPAENFIVNYHYDEQSKQKFDLNWRIASELTLIAEGSTKTDSYSSGFKLEVENKLISLSASAALDNHSHWQWKFNSRIGPFKLTYKSNQRKSSSELKTNLFQADNWGLKCAALVKYQSKIVKEEPQEFVFWGARLDSTKKIRPNQNLWSLELGWGSGITGQGLKVVGSVALKSNLTLKLDYQEVSPVSDESKIKLQLSSR
ncbi:MAG: hypothetical protein AAFQ80_09590 [Cyanobacteria bacterium J06621_8]